MDSDGSGLQEDESSGKLAEERETHSNGSDFGREDFGDVEVHCRVAACSRANQNLVSIFSAGEK